VVREEEMIRLGAGLAHVFERFKHGDTPSIGADNLEFGVLQSESDD
jgi:hypothetical protein